RAGGSGADAATSARGRVWVAGLGAGDVSPVAGRPRPRFRALRKRKTPDKADGLPLPPCPVVCFFNVVYVTPSEAATHQASSCSAAQRAVDLAERGARAGAERGDDRDAGHQDEGEHD